MKHELIINGKKYAHTPEVKEERLSGFIKKKLLLDDRQAMITPNRHTDDDTRMIEIREGEIIVSEDELVNAFKKSGYISLIGYPESLLKELFKKDGV